MANSPPIRILFAPLASPGFVFPMIGMARELARRGHETAFSTGAEFGDLLAAGGLRRLPRSEPDGPSFSVEGWGTPPEIAKQVLHLENALAAFPADAIVASQLALGPLIVGDVYRLPVAQLGMAVPLWDGPDSGGGEADPEAPPQSRPDGMLKKLQAAREFLNLPPADESGAPLLGDALWLRSTPEFLGEAMQASLPPQAECIGAALWEPETSAEAVPGLVDWLAEARDSGEPIVYAQPTRSFGVPAFWPVLVEALRDEPVRVAAATGRLDVAVGELPPRWFAARHLPQRAILPHASAVVCGGHTTAVLGALAAGLPLLCIACGSRSEAVAARCAAVGAGRTLTPFDLSPEDLREAVKAVMTDVGLRQGADAMRRSFASLDSFAVTADRLEALTARRHQ